MDLEQGAFRSWASLRQNFRLGAGLERRGPLYHVDGIDIEFAGDPRFGLVLAEAEHPDAGDQHHGGAGIAHRRIARLSVLLVVDGIFLAVLRESVVNRLAQSRQILCRVPVHVEGPDLGTNKVIGAACSQERELLRFRGVDEGENLG